ncbi:MAG TPA: hypothetical protein VF101_15875 [Gaiellaceae bacterium]
MAAADDAYPTARGATLLLEHCAALARFDPSRPSARSRLECVVGGTLARMLVDALTGDHRLLLAGYG